MLIKKRFDIRNMNNIVVPHLSYETFGELKLSKFMSLIYVVSGRI